MNHKLYLLPMLLSLLQLTAFSQDKTDSTVTITVEETITTTHNNRSYMTWGGDGALLSFGNVKFTGPFADQYIRNIPRFTIFFNVGNNYNYDIDDHFGIFTGINIKNIGLIWKANDSTKTKARVYTVGIPLGIKIGDLKGGTFFFAGGAYDMAFNYKEKNFLNGDKIHKFNEWFSGRTDLLMPSLFAGIRFSPGFGLKVQYYPNNFFNKNYKEVKGNSTNEPYKYTEAKMFFATLSYDFGKEISHPSAKVHWERKTKHWEKK